MRNSMKRVPVGTEGDNMTNDSAEARVQSTEPKRQHGNGGVAHQIIGEFIVALEAQTQYADVVARLSKVVFDGKVSDASLRLALFGELEL
jgi:hypothetical protein